MQPRFVLVGHSMGAKVAMVLASRQPPGLAGLLLIAPSPPSPEPMTTQGRQNLKAAYGHADLLREHYAQIIRQPLPGRFMDQLLADGLRASPAAWMAWCDHGSREDCMADVTQIKVPVSLLSSEDDPVITPEVVAQQLLPVFPEVALNRVHHCGHLLPLECPADAALAIQAALQARSTV